MRNKSSKKDKGSGDSIWGLIISWAKNLNVSTDVVLYDMSYVNLMLYSAATPQFDDEKDTWDEKFDANNPDNFSNSEEEIFVS